MQVSCPSCGTNYALPPQHARPGVKARCKRCGVVFPAVPADASAAVPSPAPEPPPSPAPPEPDPFASPEAAAPPAPEPAAEPAPAGGVVEAHGTFDPFSDLGDLDRPDDDPFSNIDVETDDAVPSSWASDGPMLPPPEGGRGAVGVSAIRAQSMTAAATAAPQPVEAPEGPQGWRLRREDRGDILSFRDLESVRGWLRANPGIEISLSSDGQSWRSPEEILGVAPVAESRPAARATGPARAPARRGVAARRVGEPVGAGWFLGALGSTVLALASVSITAQNLGYADLSEVVPFERLGLERFLWQVEDETLEAVPPEERYRVAVQSGDAARRQGRLIDATIAYQSALEWIEGREALEGLARAYDALGDAGRAADTRRRLERMRDTRPRSGAGDG